MAGVTVTFYPSAGVNGAEVHTFGLATFLNLVQWRVEPFSPGDTLGDAWCASLAQAGSWCLELELSSRRSFWCDRVEVAGAGFSRVVPVGMVWPAGRLLAFRLGAELPMHPSWRRRRARFGPLQMPLPNIPDAAAQATLYTARLAQLRSALAGRSQFTNEDSQDGVLSWTGPFPCWGQRDPGPGAPGGSGISFTTGWQAVPAFARFAAEAAAAAISREWAFYKADGSLVLPGDFAPGTQPEVRSQAGWKLPAWGGHDTADPLPLPQALSHKCRVARWQDAAVEMTGSPLALRGVNVCAQHALLECSHTGAVIAQPGNTSQNLATQEAISLLRPGLGLAWDRTWGHAAMRVAMAWRWGLRSDSIRDWAQRLCASLERSSTPPGLVVSEVIPEGVVGQRVTQAFHEAIVALGARGLAKAVGFPAPSCSLRAPESLYRQAYPIGPYYGQVGPYHFPWVAPVDGPPYVELTQGNGHPDLPTMPGDPAHVEVLLAVLAHDLEDPTFLDDSLRFGVPAASIAAKKAAMLAETDTQNRNWQAFLLAVVQLGGY